MENKILIVGEAAEFLRISKDSLYRLARTRQVPCKRLGRKYLFHRDVLEEYVKSGKALRLFDEFGGDTR